MSAAECVVRILALLDALDRPHGDLDGLDAERIEFEADWRGEPGLLWRGLIECGWIDRHADGSCSWHDYAAFNAKTITARVNGRSGGRPVDRRKPNANPAHSRSGTQGVTQPEPKEGVGLGVGLALANNGQGQGQGPKRDKARTKRTPSPREDFARTLKRRCAHGLQKCRDAVTAAIEDGRTVESLVEAHDQVPIRTGEWPTDWLKRLPQIHADPELDELLAGKDGFQ